MRMQGMVMLINTKGYNDQKTNRHVDRVQLTLADATGEFLKPVVYNLTDEETKSHFNPGLRSTIVELQVEDIYKSENGQIRFVGKILSPPPKYTPPARP